MCVFPLLLVLVVLHESEDSFALLNIIMSAKFLSIFRNVKNSCLVSLWSSTCHFVCYVCLRERGGQRERLCMCASWLFECVCVCVCVCVCEREREREREREIVHVCITAV